MKKRVLSVVLSLVLVIASISTAFAAQPSIDEADANVFYEGNKPFVLMERLLDELNADKEAEIFDESAHDFQYSYLRGVNSVIDSKDLEEAIGLLTEDLSDAQKMYLAACVKAESDDAFAAEFNAIDNVSDLSLKESFGKLDNYINDISVFLNAKGITVADYDADASKEIVAEPLVVLLNVIFAKDKDGMRDSYLEDFLKNDRAKKTLAVLFGSELTKEIVTDNFLSGGGTQGIVHHVKDYVAGLDGTALRDLKNQIENGILVTDSVESVDAAFDFIGSLVTAAYENDANASDSLKASVKMLMGDGTDAGLIELMVKDVDTNNNCDYYASSIWINLLLSEFIQTEITNGDPLYTVSALNPAPEQAEIKNGTHVTFKTKNLEDYGLAGDRNMSLRTGKFSLKFYVVDPDYVAPTPGGGAHGGSTNYTKNTPPKFTGYIESDYITYDKSEGKIVVKHDSSFGNEYDAYMVLFRSDLAYKETFIESYPVTVVNPRKQSGGSGGANTAYLHYVTNGGSAIDSAAYAIGTTVELTAVPVREGYIFTGWYSDVELTNKVESIVMNSGKTVYAGWKKDGSSVVSKVDVPELLEADHHYAYIMGYPEGDVHPHGNITRAETVTMIFRLLKDSVRTANLTDTNDFLDVDSDDWFNTAVSTLSKLGIVEGRTETEFAPNEKITRAEFATMFARLAQFEYVEESIYGDVDGHWAKEHIAEASAYGWIAGYEDDTFRPDKAINRAEAMTLVNRVLKRVPESKEDLLPGMTVWTDNADESAWYYLAVQEATNSHNHTMKNESYEKWTELTENRDWTTFEK